VLLTEISGNDTFKQKSIVKPMDKTISPIQKPTAKLTNLLKLGFNASGICLAIKERKKSIGKESLEFYQIPTFRTLQITSGS
jgi:hypothetical protein